MHHGHFILSGRDKENLPVSLKSQDLFTWLSFLPSLHLFISQHSSIVKLTPSLSALLCINKERLGFRSHPAETTAMTHPASGATWLLVWLSYSMFTNYSLDCRPLKSWFHPEKGCSANRKHLRAHAVVYHPLWFSISLVSDTAASQSCFVAPVAINNAQYFSYHQPSPERQDDDSQFVPAVGAEAVSVDSVVRPDY